jgi:hypothetical protein
MWKNRFITITLTSSFCICSHLQIAHSQIFNQLATLGDTDDEKSDDDKDDDNDDEDQDSVPLRPLEQRRDIISLFDLSETDRNSPLKSRPIRVTSQSIFVGGGRDDDGYLNGNSISNDDVNLQGRNPPIYI